MEEPEQGGADHFKETEDIDSPFILKKRKKTHH